VEIGLVRGIVAPESQPEGRHSRSPRWVSPGGLPSERNASPKGGILSLLTSWTIRTKPECRPFGLKFLESASPMAHANGLQECRASRSPGVSPFRFDFQNIFPQFLKPQRDSSSACEAAEGVLLATIATSAASAAAGLSAPSKWCRPGWGSGAVRMQTARLKPCPFTSRVGDNALVTRKRQLTLIVRAAKALERMFGVLSCCVAAPF
jgi:hypothetical protein